MYQQYNGSQFNLQHQWQLQQQQHYEHMNQVSTISYNHRSSANFSNLSSDQSSTEDTSSKRKQSLERNRLAAYRCRERKKNEQKQMIEQANLLTIQYESLIKTVSDLRNEVIALRELLLAHDSCQCEGVQAFLQRTSSTM